MDKKVYEVNDWGVTCQEGKVILKMFVAEDGKDKLKKCELNLSPMFAEKLSKQLLDHSKKVKRSFGSLHFSD